MLESFGVFLEEKERLEKLRLSVAMTDDKSPLEVLPSSRRFELWHKSEPFTSGGETVGLGFF